MRTVLNFLEKASLSPVNYWISLISDIFWALAFLMFGLWRFSGSWPGITLSVLVGFAAWTFLEYAIHRWLFHGRRHLAKSSHAQHRDARPLVCSPAFL